LALGCPGGQINTGQRVIREEGEPIMKENMGTVDRVLRAFVGPVLILLGLALGPGTVPGIVAFVLAGVALVTAAVGVCPGYIPFGISTRGGVSIHGRFLGDHPRVPAKH
jgi:hypothetical protein